MSGKNDANDAAAIGAAMRQPQMRFVTMKNAEQQARLAVHRLRQGLQEERTAGLNRLCGLLAEFGHVSQPKARRVQDEGPPQGDAGADREGWREGEADERARPARLFAQVRLSVVLSRLTWKQTEN